MTVELSVVIPIYNEQDNLLELYTRLTTTLDKLDKNFEIIFVNDGSKDKSIDLLRKFHLERPTQVRVIDLHYNIGQYMALMAGIEHSRGEITVTLDADLQNPPEEIPKLLQKVNEGYDLVGSYRDRRKDSWFRTYASKLINWVREKTTGLKMRDHGCMLRAYRRHIVNAMIGTGDANVFINALSQSFAGNPIDIEVKHDSRYAGESKYNFYKLSRILFDLMTGFSLIPLQMFTFFGMLVSGGSFLLVIYMVIRRLVIGPEAEGMFTLMAILIFLVSVAITGIGVVGEYVGRNYQVANRRPKYLVKQYFQQIEGDKLINEVTQTANNQTSDKEVAPEKPKGKPKGKPTRKPQSEEPKFDLPFKAQIEKTVKKVEKAKSMVKSNVRTKKVQAKSKKS